MWRSYNLQRHCDQPHISIRIRTDWPILITTTLPRPTDQCTNNTWYKPYKESSYVSVCLFEKITLLLHFHYPHSPVQQTNAPTPGTNPYQDPSCDHPNYCWPVDTLDGYIVLTIRNFCEEVKQRSKFSKETNKQIKLKFKCEDL